MNLQRRLREIRRSIAKLLNRRFGYRRLKLRIVPAVENSAPDLQQTRTNSFA
jgi:hypothetical protein